MSRIARINQQVKQEISLIIQQELADPRLQFVSITQVDVSKDLRNAKVFFSALGTDENAMAAQKALDSANRRIRGLISKRINLRYTPELNFLYDGSIANAVKLDETLKEINDEYDENHKFVED